VRSAPLTYAWLVVLLATTLVQHSLSDRLLRTLLQSTSTNLHHLASDPVRVLFNSLLWIDGKYWWPYVLIPPSGGWDICAGWSRDWFATSVPPP
jgi:hypothetical protein